MKDPYTRAREIEEAASELVAWSDEFIAGVQDSRGRSIHRDFLEVLAELREALGSLDEDPGQIANYRAKQFWVTEGHITGGRGR